MSEVRSFRSGYANRLYQPAVVSRVLRTMLDAFPEHAASNGTDDLVFDTIVGTGLSGSLIVPQLARSLARHGRRVSWLIVRKSDDRSHSAYPVEGEIGSRWLFVDDLIASGRTLRRCITTIDKWCPDVELAGVFLYGGERTSRPAGGGCAQLCTARQRRQKKWDDYDTRYRAEARANPDETEWGFGMDRNLYEVDAFDPITSLESLLAA